MVSDPCSDDSVINLTVRGTESLKRGLHPEPIKSSQQIAVFRQGLKPHFPSLQLSFAVHLSSDLNSDLSEALTCWLWELRKVIPSRLHSSLTLTYLDIVLVLHESD